MTKLNFVYYNVFNQRKTFVCFSKRFSFVYDSQQCNMFLNITLTKFHLLNIELLAYNIFIYSKGLKNNCFIFYVLIQLQLFSFSYTSVLLYESLDLAALILILPGWVWYPLLLLKNSQKLHNIVKNMAVISNFVQAIYCIFSNLLLLKNK